MCTIHVRPVESQRTVGELVAEDPTRAVILERFGIDYCCGGRQMLADVCQERGIDSSVVLAEFEKPVPSGVCAEPASGELTIAALIEHIVAVHHARLASDLPRIERLIEKCVAAHGRAHPRFVTLHGEFRAFSDDLEIHMMKEERVLFPLAAGYEWGVVPSTIHCGGIEFPIAVMEAEHLDVARSLTRFRELTDDFTAPPEACATWRELMRTFAALEQDLHFHIHEENNVLHPKALEAARQYARRC